MKSPRTTVKSSPCSPQLETACTQQWRSSPAKNKITNLYLKRYIFLAILMLSSKWNERVIYSSPNHSAQSVAFKCFLYLIQQNQWEHLEWAGSYFLWVGRRRKKLHRGTGKVLHVQRTSPISSEQIYSVYKAMCLYRIIVTTRVSHTWFSYLAQFVQKTAPCNPLCLIVSPEREREPEKLFLLDTDCAEKCPRHWAIQKFQRTL